MAKNKKKTRIRPETVAKLKLGFSTIISNDAVVRAGREFHWWTPIILAVLSVIVALVPSMVSSFNVNAGNSILGTSYGAETGLAYFLNDLSKTDADIKIADSKAEATNWGSIANDSTGKWYQHVSASTGEVTFEAYYNYFKESLSDYDFLYNRILKGLTPEGSVASSSSSSESSATSTSESSSSATSSRAVDALPYHTNCVFFGYQYFYLVTFATTSSAANVVGGQYDRLNGVSIKSLATSDLNNKAYANTFDANPRGYAEEVRKTFIDFTNRSYETIKIQRAWTTTGIMAAVFAGMEILLGLVIFLITRGKRNPYRIFTFWETQKMAYWAAPTPAVISLILGFLIGGSSLGQFAFIMVYGIRVVWLSMRTLSPAREQ